MASEDWPDLPFAPARAFGAGRDGRRATYSVIHYTAGSERSTSAEDGAAYDQHRTDGTSCHYFHDSDSTVQCVLLKNRANSAFAKGNRLGIHHELCGTQQTREGWLDPASRATIRRAAYQVARDHKRLGLPIRRLTPAQVRACWYDGAPGGICGHADITHAYPEDRGTHEDPGVSFPWDVLMADVIAFTTSLSATPEEIDMKGILFNAKGTDVWWMSDGTYRRALPDIDSVRAAQEAYGADLRTLPLQVDLANPANASAYGIDVATLASPPVELTDAQLDALADKVATRLRALTFTAK